MTKAIKEYAGTHNLKNGQEILLDDAQTKASQNAGLMRSALEAGNLREGLKYADAMLSELKAPQLAPKFYYVLCK